MQKQVSLPVVIAVVVLALAAVGFAFWRTQAPPKTASTAEGIPLPPPEAKQGNQAMQQLWTQGIMPPKDAPVTRGGQ